jgi:hypothetical protein
MTISIETGNAGTYAEVDEAQLLDICERIDELEFVLVQDTARPNEHAQAMGSAAGPAPYVVEYCTADRHHHQAPVDSPADVGRFLAGWAWRRDGFSDGYAWTELEELRGV